MRILAVKKKEKPFPPLGVFPFSSFFSLEFHLSLSLYFYNDAPRPLPQAGAQQQQPRLLPPGAVHDVDSPRRLELHRDQAAVPELPVSPVVSLGPEEARAGRAGLHLRLDRGRVGEVGEDQAEGEQTALFAEHWSG